MTGTLFGRAHEERETHAMKYACKGCGAAAGSPGYIVPKGLQDTVRCCACDAFVYNAGRVETGKEQRSVTTVHNGVRPSKRHRVLERDGFRCVCGKTGAETELHVDHILSVKDGLSEGFTEDELNDEANLMTLCVECNAGKSEKSRSLRAFMVILLRRDLRLRGVP